MVIGITGSSGSGKTTVCRILEDKYKFNIINADKIANKLSKQNKQYLKDIVEQFGTEILLEDGTLNRKKLAEIIYNSDEKRELLNKCTFKHIIKEIKNQIEQIYNKNKKAMIAIDAPLLYEAELDKICYFVISVISESKEAQIKRIIERDKITEEQAKARLNAQKPDEFYISKSQYVIINNEEIQKIEEQIEKIYLQLQNI